MIAPIWTLTKRLEKKPNENFRPMLYAVVKKSRKQHPKNSGCAATYLLSHKTSQEDEQDRLGTGKELKMNS